MKILVVTHDVLVYEQSKKKMRWTRFPYLFKELGHGVKLVRKPEWWKYPFVYYSFKPDIVISAGKIAGLITGVHNKVRRFFSGVVDWFVEWEPSDKRKSCRFVHDLTDHFSMYKSERRIWFLCNSHDYLTAPTMYNLKKFNCDDYVPNGSNFEVVSGVEKEYDAVYIGQTHKLYNIEGLKQSCERNGLKLLILRNVAYEELPKYLAKCRVAVYPISWDSSLKMYDYAALGLPVVAPKPNIAEGVGYPAYYCEDLGLGVKKLIDDSELAAEVASRLRKWFESHSGKWVKQAEEYLEVLKRYVEKGERGDDAIEEEVIEKCVE